MSAISTYVQQSIKTYKLRPIIILSSEEDGSAFDWLLRNKDGLYQIGYRNINFEMSNGSDITFLMECRKAARASYIQFQQMAYPNETLLSIAYKNFSVKRYWFTEGFVMAIEQISTDKKWNSQFIDIEFEKIVKCKNISLLKPEREQRFANSISETSDQYSGGTITILGSNHHTVYEILKKINPVCASASLFISFEKYMPITCPLVTAPFLAEINVDRKKNYDKNTKNTKTILSAYFPPGMYLFTDFSDQNPKVTNLLDQVILKKIFSAPSLTAAEQPNSTSKPSTSFMVASNPVSTKPPAATLPISAAEIVNNYVAKK